MCSVPGPRRCNRNFRLARLLMTAVVLVPIDLAADLVLLMVDLPAVFWGEFAAVGLAIIADFAIQLGFFVLELRGFSRRELARLDTLSNAFLLAHFASLNLTRTKR